MRKIQNTQFVGNKIGAIYLNFTKMPSLL